MAVSEFFLHPDNPLPATGQCSLVTTKDGIRIRIGQWKPFGKKISNGTVLLINGRAEFIERWFETIQDLRRRGFHVLTFDWRGQGGSDRLTRNPRKGHVRRFADYHHDLAAVIAAMQGMPKPHFGLAHSMGAALALEASAQGKLPLSRLVALAPMVGLSMVENPVLAKGLAATLDTFGFGKSYIPGGGATSISTKPFAGNRLTGNEARYTRNSALASAASHLSVGDPSIRWVHEAFRFMARMRDNNMPLKVTVPLLVIGAGGDRIVATPAVERFSSRLKTGSALIIPRSQHEIVMETDEIRAAFWAAFDAFIPGEPILLEDEAGSAGASEQGQNLIMPPRVA